MDIFTALLITHILGGGISLVLGMVILAVKKGSKQHVLMGKTYFFAMLTAALVAIPMSCLHPNYFLFIIGFFTAYMLLTGKFYLKKKKTDDVKALDWALTLLMLLFGIAFIALGSLNIAKSNYFGIVFIVFGSISFLFVVQDYRNFKGKSKIKNYWLTTHLQRMTGSYIASATAFLVVNNTILPGIIAWLLPTLIIVPLIISWTRKYKIEKK